MTKDPMKLIDEYLERVKIYLPLDSEETLIEMRTHLIEEAERIGNGKLTPGSAMMAIERFGDPKTAANEYAGTKKKAKFIPAEYVHPLFRIFATFISVGIAFIVGAFLVGQYIPGLYFENTLIVLIPLLIIVNLIFAIVIVAGISKIDQDRLVTEKTIFESVLGIGSAAFKPKSKLDSIGEVIMSVIFSTVLLHPAMMAIYSPVLIPFILPLAAMALAGAFKGLLFVVGGENNLTLTFEMLLSGIWIIFAMIIVNIGWPFTGVYAFSDGVWYIIDLSTVFSEAGIPFWPFDGIWAVLIFVSVVVSTWHVIVSAMKISMYVKEGKGVWWQGKWGERNPVSSASRHIRDGTPLESVRIDGSDSDDQFESN
ncbi:MAG: conserved membrane protein of unknown function [Candidatus Thorarchaeota archaeon]|nr:MAG: conserved membrane protein of unknown function [Candidatus Thorarchaeota archaeon]